MFFELTEWHKKNPNDWCALEPETYKLIARAATLKELIPKIKGKKVVYCRNWFRQHRK